MEGQTLLTETFANCTPHLALSHFLDYHIPSLHHCGQTHLSLV